MGRGDARATLLRVLLHPCRAAAPLMTVGIGVLLPSPALQHDFEFWFRSPTDSLTHGEPAPTLQVAPRIGLPPYDPIEGTPLETPFSMS